MIRNENNSFSLKNCYNYICLSICYLGIFIGLAYIIILIQTIFCSKYNILEVKEYLPINLINRIDIINGSCINSIINQKYIYELVDEKKCLISDKNYSIYYLENTNFNNTPLSKFGLKNIENCEKLELEIYDVCFEYYKEEKNIIYISVSLIILNLIICVFFIYKLIKFERDHRVHVELR